MAILDQFSLNKKTALLTGGAGLFGKHITAALAEAGANTFIASRNVEALEQVAMKHRDNGHQVTALQMDQGDENSIKNARDKILQATGRIDILVNNAVSRPMTQGWDDDAALFDQSMHINATGLFMVTRAIAKTMESQKSGSVINIGSMMGMVGVEPDNYLNIPEEAHGWHPDYFFHKGGMINFTRFCASYLGQFGARCNCVSPGGYHFQQSDEFVARYSKRTQLGRMANDTDIKGIIVFLASDASAYITGTNIPVDGGYTAK